MEMDPYYRRCCVTGATTRIQWHHNLESYANGNKGRVNEAWCILPLTERIHLMADRREVREYLDWIMLNRADDDTLRRWSKAEDLIKKRDRLNKIYDHKKNHPVL